jgi:hypothetical protein
MSRPTPTLALAALAVLAACSDRTSTDPASDEPTSRPTMAPAPQSSDLGRTERERLARRLALSLADAQFRSSVKAALDGSPVREHKVHFQRYLSAPDRKALRQLARSTPESESAVEADVKAAMALELYLPVPGHRAAWAGDDRILVATAAKDHEAPVAFNLRGERLILDPKTPPATPVLALVPVETDFDGGGTVAQLKVDPEPSPPPPSPPPGPPPGLYMTYAHFVDDFEGWLKGSPEFEVHILGQAGATDSLTSYSCAGEPAGGYYHFDQNSKDWSGSVLLFTQAQINAYKTAHPSQNMRVFVVEDDDTSCQIKTDGSRFTNLLKSVEAAYPTLTGGRDSVNVFQKWWKRANALQKVLKALASFINSNDELVGNAVESAVVGVVYPGANWVVKGANNVTNGWINLVMR